jgi:hypothetical protein
MKRVIFKVMSCEVLCVSCEVPPGNSHFTVYTLFMKNWSHHPELYSGLCTMHHVQTILYPCLSPCLSLNLAGLTLERQSDKTPKLFNSLEILPCIYF